MKDEERDRINRRDRIGGTAYGHWRRSEETLQSANRWKLVISNWRFQISKKANEFDRIQVNPTKSNLVKNEDEGQ